MNYKETIAYLFSALPMFHRIGPAAYKANLDNTILMCSLLGNPEKNLKCIHVAGTNGKGSVSHMLASVLQSAGYKTGLYTSPHLKDFRERIRINGEMAAEEWIADFVSLHREQFEKIQPSFFEMSTAMAFKYFHEQQTDIAVIETGLGGRLDSTNVIIPYVSVITNISFDHMNLLGDTIEKITMEKAGIIKNNIPVVIGEALMQNKFLFEEKALELNAPAYFADENYSACSENYDPLAALQSVVITNKKNNLSQNFECDLTGRYQLKNIVTVIQTIEVLKTENVLIPDESVLQGLKNVKANTSLLGRWQIINHHPTTICDTGHNEDGLKEVLSLLLGLKHDTLHIVLGIVNDKEIDKILNLFPKNACYYFCKANIPRGLDAVILAEQASEHGLTGGIYESVESALNEARKKAGINDIVFVGGSTFTVAEVL